MRTAALLLLVLLSAGFSACDGGDRRPVERTPAAPQPVSPRGPTTLPFAFTWKPLAGQPIYRVRVTDAAERLLYERDVRGTECPPSGELTAMMADHGDFFWSVGVLGADGSAVVARSTPVEFSLK